MIIWAAGKENLLLKAWIESRVEGLSLPDTSQCAAVLRDKKLCAAVAYYDFRTTDIMCAFASDNPRWATRQTVNALLAYPFVQLKVFRVSALIPQTNKKSRKLCRGLGFVEEGKLRKADQNGRDLMIYGLTDEDYIERVNRGQKITASAAKAS